MIAPGILNSINPFHGENGVPRRTMLSQGLASYLGGFQVKTEEMA